MTFSSRTDKHRNKQTLQQTKTHLTNMLMMLAETLVKNAGISMQDYKSAYSVCATLVNIQTHRKLLTGYNIISAELKMRVQ